MSAKGTWHIQRSAQPGRLRATCPGHAEIVPPSPGNRQASPSPGNSGRHNQPGRLNAAARPGPRKKTGRRRIDL